MNRPSDQHNDPSNETPGRDLTQWLGALAVVVALALVIGGSIGVMDIDGSLVRFILAAGLIASAGGEAVRAIAKRVA